MRMLHVLESFAPGGMETTFLHMLREFRTLDDRITHDVLAFAGGALEPAYRAAAHEVRIAGDSIAVEQHLAGSYDLVHMLFERCAYRLLPHLLARSTARVVYGKGYDLGGMYRLNEGLHWQADESMLAACDGVTFTTGQLAAGYRLPSGRTTVLRKAADVARFGKVPDPDASTPRRVLCVANLHPRKRLGDLITAFERVAAYLPDATLRFVGGGNQAEQRRLQEIAAAHRLSDRVSFAGSCADVVPEVAGARLIALPSACEGVSTALLEGMAAGRPVVATTVGHVASIVDEGCEGFLVAPGDVDAMGDRIGRLLLEPLLAARMGAAARARAAAHDAGAIARDLLEALTRPLAPGSPLPTPDAGGRSGRWRSGMGG